MKPTIEQLIRYIGEHSHYAFSRGAKLYAIETGTQLINPNDRNGRSVPYTRIVELPATLKAVRIWLGY